MSVEQRVAITLCCLATLASITQLLTSLELHVSLYAQQFTIQVKLL